MDTSSLNAGELISNLGEVDDNVLNIQIQASLPREREEKAEEKTSPGVMIINEKEENDDQF